MTELIFSFLAFVLLGALFRVSFKVISLIHKTAKFPAVVFFLDIIATFFAVALYYVLLLLFFDGVFVYQSILGFALGFFSVLLFF